MRKIDSDLRDFVGPVTEDTSAQIIQRFYDLGVYPDWWKLEPQASSKAWENISAVITCCHAGPVVLMPKQTKVMVGGRISDHKGINLPGVPVSVPAMSEKDIEDLRWGLHLTVDYIALSFVRSAADIEELRVRLREHGWRGRLIAIVAVDFLHVDTVLLNRL